MDVSVFIFMIALKNVLSYMFIAEKSENTGKPKKKMEKKIKLIIPQPKDNTGYFLNNGLILYTLLCNFHSMICSKHLGMLVNRLP